MHSPHTQLFRAKNAVIECPITAHGQAHTEHLRWCEPLSLRSPPSFVHNMRTSGRCLQRHQITLLYVNTQLELTQPRPVRV